MTPLSATRHKIVTLIPARPFDRSSLSGSITKLQPRLFSGFTVLLVPVRQRSSRQSQNFCAVNPDLVRILGPAFSFLEERKGAIKAVFCSQPSHINSL